MRSRGFALMILHGGRGTPMGASDLAAFGAATDGLLQDMRNSIPTSGKSRIDPCERACTDIYMYVNMKVSALTVGQ